MQGGKNWIFPKEINANRFFWDSHRPEIWKTHLCPSIGPNGGIVAMDWGCGPGDGIFILLRSSGIDSKKLIPPACACCLAGGSTTLFLHGS
jgi:hypothetical protein